MVKTARGTTYLSLLFSTAVIRFPELIESLFNKPKKVDNHEEVDVAE